MAVVVAVIVVFWGKRKGQEAAEGEREKEDFRAREFWTGARQQCELNAERSQAHPAQRREGTRDNCGGKAAYPARPAASQPASQPVITHGQGQLTILAQRGLHLACDLMDFRDCLVTLRKL